MLPVDAHAAVPGDRRAAVVVCSRDRAALLAESLAAIRAVLRDGDELVVVDSASVDEGVASTAAAAGARVVRVDTPGLGLARNAGWRASAGPVVVFTDDDCRPEPGWLEAATQALSEDGVGAVWGRVADGPDGPGGLALSTTNVGAPVEGSLGADLSALGHGANMAFRREVLAQLGGFDPMLGVGSSLPAGEDKDAFWRAMRAGWRVRLAPAMVVTHVRWRDDREAVRQMFRYGVGAGAVVAKRRRLSGDRGLVAGELWRHGALPALRAARHGRGAESGAALSRAAGFVVGLVKAGRLPIDADHFSHPGRHRHRRR